MDYHYNMVVKLIKMRMDTVKLNKEVLEGFCHLFEFSGEVFFSSHVKAVENAGNIFSFLKLKFISFHIGLQYNP